MTIGTFGIDEDGNFTLKYGSRVVTTSLGTLICLSPALRSFSQSIEWPDPVKDIAYTYQNYRQWTFGETSNGYKHRSRVIQTCQSVFTRLPEESAASVDLADVPAGADEFVGQVRLTRTTAPTHTWFDVSLDPRQKTSSWINWNGSGLIEAGIGITRLMHLYIESGKLKLERQQSVMGAAGGYYNAGVLGWSANSTTTTREVREITAKGTPVWTSVSSPYRKTDDWDSGFDDFAPGAPRTTLRIGAGAGSCSTADPTNYKSVYTVEVRGWFGKRSIAA